MTTSTGCSTSARRIEVQLDEIGALATGPASVVVHLWRREKGLSDEWEQVVVNEVVEAAETTWMNLQKGPPQAAPAELVTGWDDEVFQGRRGIEEESACVSDQPRLTDLVGAAAPGELQGLIRELEAARRAAAWRARLASIVVSPRRVEASDRLLSMPEVARRLGITEHQAREMGRRRQLPVVHVGERHVRVSACARSKRSGFDGEATAPVRTEEGSDDGLHP